jgi:UDP-glucose 4-epimerase
MHHIVITGGAGYIGSVVAHTLLSAGYRVTIIDHAPISHLPTVLRERATYLCCNFADSLVADYFTAHRIDALVHLAASIEVGASVTNPAHYYQNNVVKTIQLLDMARDTHIPVVIAASSSAVYGTQSAEGETDIPRLREESACDPCSPYGRTKLMMEWILKDYETAYGMRYGLLRFCNVAGAVPGLGLGERHRPETHLIPCLIDALMHGQLGRVYGTDHPTPDGSCVRDFVHVADVAGIHAHLLDYLLAGGNSLTCTVGSGEGSSVFEVLRAVQKALGQPESTPQLHARRPGDPAYLVADITLARTTLNWQPQQSALDYIVNSAVQFYTNISIN